MERDITGRMVQLGTERLSKARELLQKRVPYGPLRTYLTGREARLQFQEMDPEAKRQLIQRVGDEEWRRMMEDLYGRP